MNGQVLQLLQEHLKVPVSKAKRSELLTSEIRRFLPRLNGTSGGLGKMLFYFLHPVIVREKGHMSN